MKEYFALVATIVVFAAIAVGGFAYSHSRVASKPAAVTVEAKSRSEREAYQRMRTEAAMHGREADEKAWKAALTQQPDNNR